MSRLPVGARAVTVDRGQDGAAVDAILIALDVATVAIPWGDKPTSPRGASQRGHRFVRLVKWRTDGETDIACLKADYPWRRGLFDRSRRRPDLVQVKESFTHDTINATASAASASPSANPRRPARAAYSGPAATNPHSRTARCCRPPDWPFPGPRRSRTDRKVARLLAPEQVDVKSLWDNGFSAEDSRLGGRVLR